MRAIVYREYGSPDVLALEEVPTPAVLDDERALSPGGVHVMVGGSLARVFQLFLLSPWLSRCAGKRTVVLAHEPNKDLAFLAELLEAGELASVIDGAYALDEAPEALRRLGAGEVRGKAVISI